MADEMFLFYRNSLARNLCNEYRSLFRKDLNNKDELMRLCMRQQSIPYMATSCYEKWGLSMDYIISEFNEYINGKYTVYNCDGVNGYSYQLWCLNRDPIIVESDITHIMGCDCDINIPITKCPTIYISNNSHTNLKTKGYNSIRIYLFDESRIDIDSLDKNSNLLIYKYSPNCNIITTEKCEGKIKIFNKELKL